MNICIVMLQYKIFYQNFLSGIMRCRRHQMFIEKGTGKGISSTPAGVVYFCN